jgi:hypothetical protein
MKGGSPASIFPTACLQDPRDFVRERHQAPAQSAVEWRPSSTILPPGMNRGALYRWLVARLRVWRRKNGDVGDVCGDVGRARVVYVTQR